MILESITLVSIKVKVGPPVVFHLELKFFTRSELIANEWQAKERKNAQNFVIVIGLVHELLLATFTYVRVSLHHKYESLFKVCI